MPMGRVFDIIKKMAIMNFRQVWEDVRICDGMLALRVQGLGFTDRLGHPRWRLTSGVPPYKARLQLKPLRLPT